MQCIRAKLRHELSCLIALQTFNCQLTNAYVHRDPDWTSAANSPAKMERQMMVIKSLITVALNTFFLRYWRLQKRVFDWYPRQLQNADKCCCLLAALLAGFPSTCNTFASQRVSATQRGCHRPSSRFPPNFQFTRCAPKREKVLTTLKQARKKKMQPDELMIPTPFSHSHSHSLFYFAAESSLHLPQNTVAHLGGNVKHKLWHILTDAIEEIPIPDANSGLAALWVLRFAICVNLLCFCFTATKDTDAKVNATVWQMNFKAKRDL